MSKAKSNDGRRNNRPPAEHQFKPGQSGNKNGRPKKRSSTMLELLAAEMNSKVSIDVNGKRTKLSTKEIFVKQLCRELVKPRNAKALLEFFELIDTAQREADERKETPFKRISMDDIKKMSTDEMTALYRQTIQEVYR